MVIIAPILQQRQDHRVLPATTSSLCLLLRRIPPKKMFVYTVSMSYSQVPYLHRDTLLKVGCVYSLEEKRKEVGWRCCSKLSLGPCIGMMSEADVLCTHSVQWSILEHNCISSQFLCFVTLNMSINIDRHSP